MTLVAMLNYIKSRVSKCRFLNLGQCLPTKLSNSGEETNRKHVNTAKRQLTGAQKFGEVIDLKLIAEKATGEATQVHCFHLIPQQRLLMEFRVTPSPVIRRAHDFPLVLEDNS